MCTTNLYTYIHADGYQEQVQDQPVLCTASQYGQPCHNNIVFTHPPQVIHVPSHLPPTPQYSTSPSTPSYRSGDESDRSRGSSSSNKKRSSGVYYNGKKVLPLNRRDSNRHERIVVVENSSTPRTPPQTWNAPLTAPSSPNGNTYVLETSSRNSGRRYPVIVDERNRGDRHVQIEIVDSDTKRRRSRSHSRHTSTSSSHSDEDEKRRRRQQREKKREEEEIRDQRMRARIAQANAEINSRPILAPTYKRPRVTVHNNFVEPRDLSKALEGLNIENAPSAPLDEDLRQRLMDRMRLNDEAVGSSSRRHRVQYH